MSTNILQYLKETLFERGAIKRSLLYACRAIMQQIWHMCVRESVCVFAYVNIDVYICIYMHVYRYKYMYVHACMWACSHTCMYICMRMWAKPCTRLQSCHSAHMVLVCVRKCVDVCMHTSICIYTCICMYTWMYVRACERSLVHARRTIMQQICHMCEKESR